MLSAWEPISLTRRTESSLCPGFRKSTGEMFESIKPSPPPGDIRCQLSRLNTPALLDALIAASPGRTSEGSPSAADATVT
jgi:hypothetical protein